MQTVDKRIQGRTEPTPLQARMIEVLHAMEGDWILDQAGQLRNERMKLLGWKGRCDVTDASLLELRRCEFYPHGPDSLETELTVRCWYRFSGEEETGREMGFFEKTVRDVMLIGLETDTPTDAEVEEEAVGYSCLAVALAADAEAFLPLQEIVPFSQRRKPECCEPQFPSVPESMFRHIRQGCPPDRLFTYEVFPQLRKLGERRKNLRLFFEGSEYAIGDGNEVVVRFSATKWQCEEERELYRYAYFWDDDDWDEMDEEDDDEENGEDSASRGWKIHPNCVWELQEALERFSESYEELPWPKGHTKPRVTVLLSSKQRMESVTVGGSMYHMSGAFRNGGAEMEYGQFASRLLSVIRCTDPGLFPEGVRALNPMERRLCRYVLHQEKAPLGKLRKDWRKEGELTQDGLERCLKKLCTEDAGTGRPLLREKRNRKGIPTTLEGDLLEGLWDVPARIPRRDFLPEEFEDLKPDRQRALLLRVAEGDSSPDERWRYLEAARNSWSMEELRAFAAGEGAPFFRGFEGQDGEYVRLLLEEDPPEEPLESL